MAVSCGQATQVAPAPGAEVRRVAAAHITVPEEESTSMLNDKTREPKPAGSVRGSLLS